MTSDPKPAEQPTPDVPEGFFDTHEYFPDLYDWLRGTGRYASNGADHTGFSPDEDRRAVRAYYGGHWIELPVHKLTDAILALIEVERAKVREALDPIWPQTVKNMLDRFDRAKGKGGYPSANEREAMRRCLAALSDGGE